jgi:hypothetical protein
MTYPFTLIAPVLPHRRADLLQLLEQMAPDPGHNLVLPFAQLTGVHFGRVMIIDADTPTTDTLLSMETNFDGHWSAHLADILQTVGPGLEQLFSHCAGFTGDVAAFIHEHRKKTAAFYQGHRHQSREQILQERVLQQEIRRFLDTNATSLAELTQRNIHERIQNHIKSQPQFAWAIQNRGLSALGLWWQENHALLGIYAGLALVFSAVATLMPYVPERTGLTVLLVWLSGMVVALFAMLTTSLRLLVRLFVAFSLGLLLSKLTGVWVTFGWAALLAVATAGFLQVGVIGWWTRRLNRLEEKDARIPVVIKTGLLTKLQAVEDVTPQNQLTHVVRMKSGTFRLRSLKTVQSLIYLLAKVLYNKGNLGGIPTIHFARWVFIDNNQRLLFNSNYDGSWESYLGDFTDKAAQGLTAVWSHTVNFPQAKNLIGAGARDEQLFKIWARTHQIPTQVWYSAYPDVSVVNVNNNSRIRDGLFRPLTGNALARWFRRL